MLRRRAMNRKKILFATDFSDLSQAALAYATTLAQHDGATLFIVHVIEPPPTSAASELYMAVPMESEEDAEGILRAVVPSSKDVPVEHKLLRGNPADEIVRLADEEGCDLIVLATHGRTGLLRLVMGSVAEAVVRRARCPVLTVKHPTTVTFDAP